jgi:hypothetical protein
MHPHIANWTAVEPIRRLGAGLPVLLPITVGIKASAEVLKSTPKAISGSRFCPFQL